MAVIGLNREVTAALLALPETGAGFQLISARLRNSRRDFLVLNADRALELSDIPELIDPRSLILINLWISEALNSSPLFILSPSLSEIELLTTRVHDLFGAANSFSSSVALAPASSLVKSTVLSHPRRFHRFSAFHPDKRVDPTTGDFSSGTYACPDSELPFVPTGFAAVGRFALPSPLPASNHYVIEAAIGTPVQFGTVGPAFGQSGGGVEALFTAGATNVASPKTPYAVIPDE